MVISKEELEIVQEELKWVSLEKTSFSNKLQSKGITGILVPLGALITTGILSYGVYNMLIGNQKKQQILMRLRVGAQGITICLAVFEIYWLNKV